jgi:chromosome segregation ATPase
MSPSGLFGTIRRLFTGFGKSKERSIGAAASAQFTDSVDGIDQAFELHRETLMTRFGELRGVVSSLEALLEERRLRLEDMNGQEETLLRQRDGAVHLAETAQAKGDTTAYQGHAAAFERFEARVEDLERSQARVAEEIAQTSGSLERSMDRLRSLREEIDALSRQRSQALTDFVSNQQLLELDDRLHGLESSLDQGPLSAVLEANRQLTARARLAEELNAPTTTPSASYEEAGRAAESRGRLERLIQQRKTSSTTEDPRPEI